VKDKHHSFDDDLCRFIEKGEEIISELEASLHAADDQFAKGWTMGWLAALEWVKTMLAKEWSDAKDANDLKRAKESYEMEQQ